MRTIQNLRMVLGISVLAGLAACVAPASGQKLEFRVSHGVNVNGRQLATSERVYDGSGNCTPKLVLYTDSADPNVQYSIVERACDTNKNGTVDYLTWTRTGRGEPNPYSVAVAVPNLDGTESGKCVVLTQNTGKSGSVSYEAGEPVPCSTLLKPVAAPAIAKP